MKASSAVVLNKFDKYCTILSTNKEKCSHHTYDAKLQSLHNSVPHSCCKGRCHFAVFSVSAYCFQKKIYKVKKYAGEGPKGKKKKNVGGPYLYKYGG